MLSFQVVGNGHVVQIYGNTLGIQRLKEAIDTLMAQDAPSHLHLRGPSAGGNDLSERTPFGEQSAWEVVIDYNPHAD